MLIKKKVSLELLNHVKLAPKKKGKQCCSSWFWPWWGWCGLYIAAASFVTSSWFDFRNINYIYHEDDCLSGEMWRFVVWWMGYRHYRETCCFHYGYYRDDRDSRCVFIVGTCVLDCTETDRQTDRHCIDTTIRISSHVFINCEEIEVETGLLRVNPFADMFGFEAPVQLNLGDVLFCVFVCALWEVCERQVSLTEFFYCSELEVIWWLNWISFSGQLLQNIAVVYCRKWIICQSGKSCISTYLLEWNPRYPALSPVTTPTVVARLHCHVTGTI